jgi:tripartite-type tricarboxylate transporter receptor subunit TctC
MTMSVRPIALNSQNRLVAAAFVLAALSLAVPAKAQTIEEFYRKTPVQLLIGFPVANAYDTYGRAVARHLGKHIPGSPTVIPVNRPGAGSLTAANFLYNAAPKDGSTSTSIAACRLNR